jgi:hypothetical protein
MTWPLTIRVASTAKNAGTLTASIAVGATLRKNMIRLKDDGTGFKFTGASELMVKSLMVYFKVTEKDIQEVFLQLLYRGFANKARRS